MARRSIARDDSRLRRRQDRPAAGTRRDTDPWCTRHRESTRRGMLLCERATGPLRQVLAWLSGAGAVRGPGRDNADPSSSAADPRRKESTAPAYRTLPDPAL